MNKRKTGLYIPSNRTRMNCFGLAFWRDKMNIMVYQVEKKTDGTMGVEPIALYSRLIEAKNHIGQWS
jgi:hypothetical protein